jgi:hypothetical protein
MFRPLCVLAERGLHLSAPAVGTDAGRSSVLEVMPPSHRSLVGRASGQATGGVGARRVSTGAVMLRL